MDILKDLFFPPYDPLGLFVIALLALCIIYLVSVVEVSRENAGIARFFELHEVKEGKVIKYGFTSGASYVTNATLIPGVFAVPIPHLHQGLDTYTITLECWSGSLHFLATYRIPAMDYEEREKGAVIQVDPDWEPTGYQLI